MRYRYNEVNLHTHSYYCRHGKGEIVDYVNVAKAKGLLKVLGFSEHAPLPDRTLDYGTRMAYSELDDYERDVKRTDSRRWSSGAAGSGAAAAFLPLCPGGSGAVCLRRNQASCRGGALLPRP